ncbi:MAG: DUF2927 domain-containing protein [Paracoccaceae bacterium]
MKRFGAPRVSGPSRSNAEIAGDFLDLEFRMESGRSLPVLTRFEGPITVALKGDVPATASADLTRVIQRFRSEAGIDVSQTANDAAITVEFISRRQIQATYNNVACFVVPRVSSWAEYRSVKGTDVVDWTTVTRREKVAIFVPSDTSPQEVRDCLHEELAQAMGPLNDLYQLPDSVFNDDNFHTVLTGFDMLILRLHYSSELRTGMTQAEVAGRLPALLARMNPAGQRAGIQSSDRTPRAWVNAIEAALGPRSGGAARRNAAQMALSIAMAQGWHDSRLAFSYFAVGRLNLGHDPAAAVAAFNESARLYRSLPGGQIHAAHVDMQLAANALSSGQPEQAIALADRAMPVVQAGENAALLATLLLVKSEALSMLGREDEAKAARLDSLGWARYGFGAESVVRARMSDIAALVPANQRG